ncbi:hypothetical protein GZH47_00450 [Paenibacillus rhizovicinus]|uniref:Uncharacterized protein n=1 Tax=Paenibacillus rhizovicinus TaxID=2704463 RepID=A0A6C0NTG8_9BACL|nr:hypothetical protein [Paenibacillus rhizovicinus]QHW29448.1 hypothetical protein GZH47_00450 [Paenibacillus rhizovicinus]
MKYLTCLALLFVFLGAQVIYACDPGWDSDEMSEKSIAMIKGTVISTDNHGRIAHVKVIQYIGPGDAPKLVHFPATTPSAVGICEDMSTRYKAGKTYFFYLKKVGPDPEVLFPGAKSALPVEDNNTVRVDIAHNESPSAVAQEFASAHHEEIKTPGQAAEVWGKDNSLSRLTIVLLSSAGFIIVLLVVGAIVFLKRKK